MAHLTSEERSLVNKLKTEEKGLAKSLAVEINYSADIYEIDD